jgi:hypothetical protein
MINTNEISEDNKLRILKLQLQGLTYVQAMKKLGLKISMNETPHLPDPDFSDIKNIIDKIL